MRLAKKALLISSSKLSYSSAPMMFAVVENMFVLLFVLLFSMSIELCGDPNVGVLCEGVECFDVVFDEDAIVFVIPIETPVGLFWSRILIALLRVSLSLLWDSEIAEDKVKKCIHLKAIWRISIVIGKVLL